MAEKLGLREVVAMGVGGIIGGGIFVVLGVAANLAGHAAFLTYLLAGLIALASGHSYVQLTSRFEEDGGSFTFLEHYVSNIKIAGVVGWILIVGYIGTMAMYAYAFGAFTANLVGLGSITVVRPLISVGVIGVFVAVNWLGVRETGGSEDILVYSKVAILSLFVAVGIAGILTRPDLHFLSGGVFPRDAFSPIVAIGAIFVSFEGFQLLTYEYSDIQGGISVLRKGIIGSIVLSTLIYVLVAFVTTSLVTPEQIVQHEETILAFAATKIFSGGVLNQVFFVLISVAALFSTASAINATLFGTARLGHKVASERVLPTLFSFKNKKGIPAKSLLLIGALTALFTFFGTLQAITTFASISFILIFGVVNLLAFKERDSWLQAAVAGFGIIGTTSALCLLLWHLYTEQTVMLAFIAAVFIIVILLELFYFERDLLIEKAHEVEEEL